MRFELSAESFARVFPFHLGIRRDLRVAGFGASLAKLLPGLAVDARVADFLDVRRPEIGWDFEAIAAHRGSLFILSSKDGRLTLRGQMEPAAGDCCLFLGSPWLDERGSLKGLGLGLKDFAVHDAVTQLVSVLATRDMALDDVRRLAARLQETLAELQQQYRKLEDKEAMLRSTLAVALDAVITIDEPGCIVEFNPAAEAMFGRSRAEVLGKSFTEYLIPQRLRASYQDGLAASVRAPTLGTGSRMESVGLHADGTEFPMEVSISVFQHAGRPLFTGYIRDISQRRQAEAALRERGERLRAILDSAVEGIITIDEQGIIESANPAAARIFGYGSEEMVGRQVSTLMPEPYCSAHSGYIRHYMESGVRHVIGSAREARGRRKDGSEFPVRLSVGEVILGETRLFTGLISDITERKQAEESARATAARLAGLIRSMYTGVLLEDAEHRVLLTNPALCAIFGLPGPAEAMVGADCRASLQFVLGLFKAPETLLQRTEKALAGGEEVHSESFELRDGRTLERDYVPILQEGVRTGHLWLYRDITERVRLSAELASARNREIAIGARIQQTLLFGRIPDDFLPLEIAALSLPSKGIDGDFYDFLPLDANTLDVVIGDVMGKGVPAALMGAACRNHILLSHTSTTSVEGVGQPEEIVGAVHGAISPRLADLGAFITMVYARFDLRRGTVTFVDCGHTRSLHLRAADRSATTLAGANVPLGFLAREIYRQQEVTFAEGDAFVFYSDGLTEARSPDGEFFGEERLIECAARVPGLEPHGILQALREATDRFAEGRPHHDDLTCIVVRVRMGWERKTIRLAADFSELSRVRELVRLAGRQGPAPLSEDASDALCLAVNEAYTNVVRHAYKGEFGRTVELVLQVSPEAVVVELHHTGGDFDPSSVPAPSFDGSREGGFGLYIMESCVDQVSYGTDAEGRKLIRLAKRRVP